MKNKKVKALEERIAILRYAVQNKIDESTAGIRFRQALRIKQLLHGAIKITRYVEFKNPSDKKVTK